MHFSTRDQEREFYRVEELSSSSVVQIDLMSYFNPFGGMELEQVTVPAGTFDSIKVTKTFEIAPPSPMAGTDVFTAWYVKNIGMVKRVQEDDSLWELTRHDTHTP